MKSERRKPLLFAVFAILSFFLCFILGPLGSFVAWIFGGATVYLLFMAIYSLIPAEKKQFVQRRIDPRQAETKAYISAHKPILISLFFAGILLVIAILMAVS
ncbi:MAG TPA: hypothetical protein VFO54_08960 [Chryseosolibacter sp.]|nr:hypothetical protein [Chryseosolibacter sp.]